MCTNQFGNAGRGRAVGAPFDTLEIGAGADGLLDVDALRWPRHRVQQGHALLSQFFLQEGLLHFVELHGFVVAVGQEGQAVGTKKLPFILKVHQQNFTDLRLTTLHGALDFRRLEQGTIGVHRDLQFAGAGFVYIVGKLGQVLGVEVGCWIGSGQVPFGLGRGRAGGQGDGQCGSGGAQGEQTTFHKNSG